MSDYIPITVINHDGTERTMDKGEFRSFFDALAETAKVLDERDDWDACKDALNEIPDLVIDSIGGYVPIQAWGTYQGEPCYFRARHQHATFSVGSWNSDGEMSSWMAKRQAGVQVCGEDDPYGAGYLPSALIPDLIGRVLIPNLQPRTKEEGEAELDAFSDMIKQMADAMTAARDAQKSE